MSAEPNDISDQQFQRVFEYVGNTPHLWYYNAEHLWSAAKVLEKHGREVRNTLGVLPWSRMTEALLKGFAIEVCLKAIWIDRGIGRFVEPGKKVTSMVAALKHHKLAETATAARVEVSDTEFDVLERLTAIVRFAGRYPIAMKEEDSRPIQTSEGAWRFPSEFSEAEFATVEALWERLKVSEVGWFWKPKSEPANAEGKE